MCIVSLLQNTDILEVKDEDDLFDKYINSNVWILLSQDLKALQLGSQCGCQHPHFTQER